MTARGIPKRIRGVQPRGGFTLVEIIVSFAILALISVTVIAAVVGMGGIQQRDNQERADNATVLSSIASDEEPDANTSLSLPLGEYEVPGTADTYSEGLDSLSLINPGESVMPNYGTDLPTGIQELEGGGSDGYVKDVLITKPGYYKLEVWGASGGGGTRTRAGDRASWEGGRGGYSVGIVYLREGDRLWLYAGGSGTQSDSGSAIPGGTNGGGAAGAKRNTSTLYARGSGGGASDIRINGESLYHRVIVAGGGGGGGGSNNVGALLPGGAGGGDNGVKPSVSGSSGTISGGGGERTRGGAAGMNFSYGGTSGMPGLFGFGGDSGSPTVDWWVLISAASGGGGGGWYGGGGGPGGGGTGGGGGSGWVYTEDAYRMWLNSTNRADALKYELTSDYWLINAKSLSGDSNNIPDPNNPGGVTTGRVGNGLARVSWVGTTKPT